LLLFLSPTNGDYRKAFTVVFLEIYFRMRRNRIISASSLKSVITVVLSDIAFLKGYLNFGYFTTFKLIFGRILLLMRRNSNYRAFTILTTAP